MAKVITLPPRAKQTPVGAAPADGAGASIIIFPGVRYERRDGDVADKEGGRSGTGT